MRDIKFRAWDKTLLIMLPQHEMSCYKDFKRFGREATLEGFLKHPEYELMQYTGLKDKNGKEIWEGDICQRLESDNSKVLSRCMIIYKEDRFALEWITKSWFNDSLRSHFEDLEVIGNIYQN
jgi:uncharacterized phage protein (TIGR01671 family)